MPLVGLLGLRRRRPARHGAAARLPVVAAGPGHHRPRRGPAGADRARRGAGAAAGARDRPARRAAQARRRPPRLGRLLLAGRRVLPVPRAAGARTGAALAGGACRLGRAAGAAVPGGRQVTVARRLFLARGLAVTAGAVALGTAGTGRTSRTPRRSSAGCRSPFRAWTRRSTGCGSSRSPTPTCRPPTADGASSGWSRSSTPSARTSSRSSATWSTAAWTSSGRTSPRWPTWSATRASSSSPATTSTSSTPGRWLRHLPTLGVQVLHNERVPIRRGTASFDLAGIDDRTAAGSGVPGQGADLDAALDGRDDGTPVVLLAHQPVMVEQAAGGRGRPAAVRAHPRRAAVALRLRHPPGPAGGAGLVAARRHPALRHRGRRLLGAADAGRCNAGGHRGRAPGARRLNGGGQRRWRASKASSISSSSLRSPLPSAQASSPAVYAER